MSDGESECLSCHGDVRALDVIEPDVFIESRCHNDLNVIGVTIFRSRLRIINQKRKWRLMVRDGWQDRQCVIQIACALAGPA